MSSPSRSTTRKREKTDWIEAITSRIGKISTLVIAVAGLLMLILNSWAEIKIKWNEIFGQSSSSECVVVSEFNVPATVEYSEWDDMRINISGSNDCDEALGLYVTFRGRATSEPRFRLSQPYEGPNCNGSTSVLVPECWDLMNPVAIGKGDWEWSVLPPPLAQLSDPVPVANISATWEVRDAEKPDSEPLWVGSKQIKVTNKNVQP